jgi:hypothetical protein
MRNLSTLIAIKAEITNDPISVGYTAKAGAAAASLASLFNNPISFAVPVYVYSPVPASSIAEICLSRGALENIEAAALDKGAHSHTSAYILKRLLELVDPINTQSLLFKDALDTLVAEGILTLADQEAILVLGKSEIKTSRAQQLNLGMVDQGDIEAALAIK